MRAWALCTLFLLLASESGAETITSTRPAGADELPLTHPRLTQPDSRVSSASQYGFLAEQVHITFGGGNRIAVSWVTARGPQWALPALRRLLHHHDATPSMVSNCEMDDVRSVVQYGVSRGNYESRAVGWHTCYERGDYKSGLLHTAVLGECGGSDGLRPGQTYFYKVGDPRVGWSDEFRFTMPPAAGDASKPLRVAVFGDLGQTAYSLETLTHMAAVGPDLALNLGDLSYADGDQARWDSWARMIQPLMSKVPMVTIEGNHDEDKGAHDKDGTYIPFQAYSLRYFVPYVASGSGSNLYYSFEAGFVHFAMIGSYADYKEGSPQFQWLQADLASVDRARTPWVVVGMHKQWYSSNKNHLGKGLKIASSLEPLLYEYGVDLVLQAHVHAYERTARVFKGELDACGPLYITVGDGGNRKGLDTHWVKPQPRWSVVREDSYGFGVLDVGNGTHMRWGWLRNEDSEIAADSLWIGKPSTCPNRASGVRMSGVGGGQIVGMTI